MAKEYTEDSIDVLKGIEHIRKRPGMYIPNVEKEGFHHLIKEVVDNSIDEYMNGHATQMDVVVDLANNEITIRDDGRGIPVATHKKTGKSTLITVFMETGAGGKFNKDSYSVSAGLHGVGITVVNALSEWVEVWVNRQSEGGKFYQAFKNGDPVSPDPIPEKKWGDEVEDLAPDQKGTAVRFKPDASIFKKVKGIDDKLVRAWLKEQSFLSPGFKINYTIKDGKEKTFEEFVSQDGLSEMIKLEVEAAKAEPINDPLHITNKDKTIDVVLSWTDMEEEKWFMYVNSSPTPEGGTHTTGVTKAITEAFKDQSSKDYINDDLRIGLFVAIHVKVSEPLFKGQTKSKLLNGETTSEVYDAILPELQKFVGKNPTIVKQIVDRAVAMRKARESFKKQKEALKSITLVNKKAKGVLPGKLTECPWADPADRELFIVEGESAGGTVKRARNADFQELLPLRGKIPNASQTGLQALLKNTEIHAIITSIGSGIHPNCDPKKARVGKIMLLMDADPDGHHIASLALSFLVYHMWPVVEAGMVYIVNAPLFITTWKDKRYFAHTIKELRAQLPGNAKPDITRLKGHGEANPEDLKEYAMDKTTRKLFQINVDAGKGDTDPENDENIVLKTMGADSSFRKVILGLEEDHSEVANGKEE